MEANPVGAGPRWQISDTTVSADLDNECMLLNVETGLYFGLDELGTSIWKLIGAGSSVELILQHLLQEYEVGPDELRRDLFSFLALLGEKGLLEKSVS